MNRIISASELPAGGTTVAQKEALALVAALGRAARATHYVGIAGAHVSGVSHWNLGPEGLAHLESWANTGRVVVPTTLNPCAFWPEDPPFWVGPEDIPAQARVLSAYSRMGVMPTCTCAPYLSGQFPLFGTHLAWSESSAVTFANAICGARTGRNGGPAALAAALCGLVPYTGLHLDENRVPQVGIRVKARLDDPLDFGLLGAWIGRSFGDRIPFLVFEHPGAVTVEHWQALCAAIVTYGGASMFHVHELTPEAACHMLPPQAEITGGDLEDLRQKLTDLEPDEPVDMVFSGCPHPDSDRLRRQASDVVEEPASLFILACAASRIPGPAGKNRWFLQGGCPAVSPLPKGMKTVVTSSAKAAFYLRSRGYRVGLATFAQCAEIARTGRWPHAL